MERVFRVAKIHRKPKETIFGQIFIFSIKGGMWRFLCGFATQKNTTPPFIEKIPNSYF